MEEHIPFELFEKSQLTAIPEGNENVEGLTEGKRIAAVVLPYQNKEEVAQQLYKIFAACNIHAAEIVVCNNVNWSILQKVASLKEIFLFGVNPKDLGIFYTLFPYRFLDINRKKVLLADALDVLLGQHQLKADFWHKCLKPYYIGN
jgi:hypothetical protein